MIKHRKRPKKNNLLKGKTIQNLSLMLFPAKYIPQLCIVWSQKGQSVRVQSPKMAKHLEFKEESIKLAR